MKLHDMLTSNQTSMEGAVLMNIYRNRVIFMCVTDKYCGYLDISFNFVQGVSIFGVTCFNHRALYPRWPLPLENILRIKHSVGEHEQVPNYS